MYFLVCEFVIENCCNFFVPGLLSITKIVTHNTAFTLTNSMDQSSSWEANRASATQEIHGILWNPKFHNHIHNSPPEGPVWFQGLCIWFVTCLSFYGKELLAPRPTPQAERPPLVGCPRLLILHIHSYPPYLQAVPPSATSGRAMPWWQGPNYHGLSHSTVIKIIFSQTEIFNVFISWLCPFQRR
jgi:hypothetical protein